MGYQRPVGPFSGSKSNQRSRWAYVVSHWQVDPLVLGWEVERSDGVILDKGEHICRADTAAEQNAGRAKGTCGEDNTALRRDGDHTECGIVG